VCVLPVSSLRLRLLCCSRQRHEEKGILFEENEREEEPETEGEEECLFEADGQMRMKSERSISDAVTVARHDTTRHDTTEHFFADSDHE
jgi:hypothetical protein